VIHILREICVSSCLSQIIDTYKCLSQFGLVRVH